MLTRRSFAKGIALLPACPMPFFAAADHLHAKPDDRMDRLPDGRLVHTRWIWREGAWCSANIMPDA